MWSSSTGELIKTFDGLKGGTIKCCDIAESGKLLVISIQREVSQYEHEVAMHWPNQTLIL